MLEQKQIAWIAVQLSEDSKKRIKTSVLLSEIANQRPPRWWQFKAILKFRKKVVEFQQTANEIIESD